MTSRTARSAAGGQGALVVIDMQAAFGDSTSEWFVPRYDEAQSNIETLVGCFAGRVVWTRFVRYAVEPGSWADYYDRWASLRLPASSPVWDLTLDVAEDDRVLSMGTFSKWGAELGALTGPEAPLVVCGVATDCCVLSTVLGAVDEGRSVTVVADACAGVTDTAHQQALDLMDLLSPMVTLATTAEIASATLVEN